MRKLDMVKERASAFEDRRRDEIYQAETNTERKKKKTHRTSKNCEAITKDVTYIYNFNTRTIKPLIQEVKRETNISPCSPPPKKT